MPNTQSTTLTPIEDATVAAICEMMDWPRVGKSQYVLMDASEECGVCGRDLTTYYDTLDSVPKCAICRGVRA